MNKNAILNQTNNNNNAHSNEQQQYVFQMNNNNANTVHFKTVSYTKDTIQERAM